MCWSRGGRARGGWGYARQLGAEAIQVFVPNPRGWALSAGDPRQDAAFRDEVTAAGLPVVVHAPYLINVASPGQATWQRVGGGTAAFAGTRGRHRRPGRGGAHRLGGRLDRAGALRREREALPPVLDSLGEQDPDLLLDRWPARGSCSAAGSPASGTSSARWAGIRGPGSAWIPATCSPPAMT